MSGIIRVGYYQAAPIERCDRCGQGIKHVFVVKYRDGVTEKYGSECINKILAGDTSLKSLFNKNAKLLQKYQRYLAVLNMPEEEMPRGSEYFGSGLYFIGDGEGKDISFDGHWQFHPIYDADKNGAGVHYVVTNPQDRLKRDRAEIEKGKVYLQKEITRIEGFLARVLAKAQSMEVAHA